MSPLATFMIRSTRPLCRFDWREAHRDLEAGVRVVDLLELDGVEVHTGHDLGHGLAIFELTSAQLREARHGADREVRRLGVDEVDLRPLGQQVDDDLLCSLLSGTRVQGTEVFGIRVDGQNAF